MKVEAPSNRGRVTGLEADLPPIDVEVTGLGSPAIPPPAALPLGTPDSSGSSAVESSQGIAACKARTSRPAGDTRARVLNDPQATQWQEKLEKETKRTKEAQKPDQADQIRAMIEELRGEARAYRQGAIDVMAQSPDGQDAIDSTRFMGIAMVSDGEANSLEPKLATEEEKRKRGLPTT